MQLVDRILHRQTGHAEHAHFKAHNVISESRSGLCVSEEEIARLNAVISPLVNQGQSIHQIYINYENKLMCSERPFTTTSMPVSLM